MRTTAVVHIYQDFFQSRQLNVIFQPAREGRLFFVKSLFTKTYTTMKEFINFMQNDIEKETSRHETRWCTAFWYRWHWLRWWLFAVR